MAPQDPSRFRCTECGDCCRRHRVPLTVSDLARLVEASGEPPASLIEWLSPAEIDMTGEPESFVTLRQGRRLPVLAFRDGACRFLGPDERCRVYAARPASCRTFPLELGPGDADGQRRHLTLLEGAECPGEFDADPNEHAIFSALERRQHELEGHVALVGVWNRRQRRLALAGWPAETAEAFLHYLMDELEGPD